MFLLMFFPLNPSYYLAILDGILGSQYRRVADILLGFYAWGGGISFLMLVMAEIKQLAVAWHIDHPHQGIMLFVVVLVIVFPLSLMRHLDR